MSNTPFKSSSHDAPIKTKKTADEILADIIQTPITCQSLLDSSNKGVIAQSDISGYHLLPVSGINLDSHLTTRYSFAQTVSFMPSNTSVTSYSSPEFVNVNLKNPNMPNPKFHGIPTSDHQWFRIDLWSTTTGQNNEYDYQVSDSNVYDVIRHGFRVKRAGSYKVKCTLHLESFVTNRYNVAMQFAKKPDTLHHVDSAETEYGGIVTPSATDSNFTRVGVPVATGYVNLHSSGTTPNESKHIECIVNLHANDEIALFTTSVGVFSGGLYALVKYCSFSINSM